MAFLDQIEQTVTEEMKAESEQRIAVKARDLLAHRESEVSQLQEELSVKRSELESARNEFEARFSVPEPIEEVAQG